MTSQLHRFVTRYSSSVQNRVTSFISTIGLHPKTSAAAAGATGIAAAGLAYVAVPYAAAAATVAAPIALPLAAGAAATYTAWKRLVRPNI